MAYKHNDSCLAKVREDEPIFVLRGQDVLAPDIVRAWAEALENLWFNYPAVLPEQVERKRKALLKAKEAFHHANVMEAYQRSLQDQGMGKVTD